jgi:aminoglycoside phosphotransferase family enzyme/predicted kinase
MRAMPPATPNCATAVGENTLPAALLRGAAFPHPVRDLRVIETALSWIILTGDYAYKVKKPLHNDFVDASTLDRRHFLCREELRLNQRYSERLYLDVVQIGTGPQGLQLDSGDQPIEYAVRMRQFDVSHELAHALGQQRVSIQEMENFGRDLARLHSKASTSLPDMTFGTPRTIEQQILANFVPLREALRNDVQGTRNLVELERWTRSRLRALRSLLSLRVAGNCIRECHGDLHAGNVLQWEGRWRPFDCLEFDPALRWIDVISDVAFIFMDLGARDRPDLAYALLNAYLDESGDYEGVQLLPLYAVYRALVRAKVASLVSQPGQLQRYLAAATVLAEQPRAALILMHGMSASGKSWLSGELARTLPGIRIRSDRERQRYPATPAGSLCGGTPKSGRYAPQRVLATYHRLRFCAECALAAGFIAVVDATFLQRSRRREFEVLADRQGCMLLIVACEAPLPVLEQRLHDRRVQTADLSEATADVLAAQWSDRKAFDASERRYVIFLDSTSPDFISHAITAVRARLSSSTTP